MPNVANYVPCSDMFRARHIDIHSLLWRTFRAPLGTVCAVLLSRRGTQRRWVSHSLTLLEDVVYLGLGLLLGGSALALLATSGLRFGQDVLNGTLGDNIIVLIAATRRILVLTAEFSKLLEQGEAAFRNAMLELGL